MLTAIKNWAKEREEQLKTIAMLGAIGIGMCVFYSKSFDYGYNCRVDLEKLAGNGLYEAIEKFGNQ